MIDNIKYNEHPNYQQIQSLIKEIPNFEEGNPILIELRRQKLLRLHRLKNKINLFENQIYTYTPEDLEKQL